MHKGAELRHTIKELEVGYGCRRQYFIQNQC